MAILYFRVLVSRSKGQVHIGAARWGLGSVQLSSLAYLDFWQTRGHLSLTCPGLDGEQRFLPEVVLTLFFWTLDAL